MIVDFVLSPPPSVKITPKALLLARFVLLDFAIQLMAADAIRGGKGSA